MPFSEEQVSRELAALDKTLTDFRNEMRATLNGFVRQDVYQAQQDAMKAAMAAEVQLLRNEIQNQAAAITAINAEKRQNRGFVWSALGAAAVSILLSVFRLK